MKLVDNLDELQKTIILNNLVPCMPIDDVTYLVPAESSTYIYLKGGVYVNE